MTDDEEADGLALMAEAQARILDGVERLSARWVESTVLRIAPGEDESLRSDAHEAGIAASGRVIAELRDLFACDPAQQRATPLEVVRTLCREVTAVLSERGVPPVARDPFDVRAFPDDAYAVVPRSLSDLGDEELGPLLLAWGLGKSKVLRARATRRDSSR